MRSQPASQTFPRVRDRGSLLIPAVVAVPLTAGYAAGGIAGAAAVGVLSLAGMAAVAHRRLTDDSRPAAEPVRELIPASR